MNKLYNILFTLIISTSAMQAQVKVVEVPIRDSANRDSIHFDDYRIRESKAITQLEPSRGVKRDKLTGRFMYQDSNGRTVDLEVKDNIATGNWQYYSSTYQGPIISSMVSFVDGHKHGDEITYSFEMNKEKELFESYLRRVTRYNMSKKQHEISYWSNGSVSTEEHYDEEGRSHSKYLSFHSDGSTSTEGEYVHGKRVGTWHDFYEDRGEGNPLQKETRYEGGKTHGTWYYRDGTLMEKRTVTGRLYQGEYLFLRENGDTLQHHFYKDGVEQGYQLVNSFAGYHKARYIARYTTNDEGVIQGKYTQQFEGNQFFRIVGNYNQDGERDGLWKYYLFDGRLYRTENIENGRVRGSSNFQLYDIYTKQAMDEDHHLQAFPGGKMPVKELKPVFFLFSE